MCVGGSIPPLVTSNNKGLMVSQFLRNAFFHALTIQLLGYGCSSLKSSFRTKVRITLCRRLRFVAKVIAYMTRESIHPGAYMKRYNGEDHANENPQELFA